MKNAVRIPLFLLLAVTLAACATTSQHRSSGSVVNFLFPKEENVQMPLRPQGPVVLPSPMRVGIAFIPPRGNWDTTNELKASLLGKIREAFLDVKYIDEIEIIPPSYLGNQSGFEGLARVAGIFNVDVIALISYDQIQHSDTTRMGWTYLTIIGAYTIPAQKNETRTMMETSVFDIPSRALLLHAQATDVAKGRSTAIDVDKKLRRSSTDSFRRATDNLIADLDVRLAGLEKMIDAGEPIHGVEIHIAPRSTGYGGAGGAGDFGWAGAAAALALLLTAAAKRRQQPRAS